MHQGWCSGEDTVPTKGSRRKAPCGVRVCLTIGREKPIHNLPTHLLWSCRPSSCPLWPCLLTCTMGTITLSQVQRPQEDQRPPDASAGHHEADGWTPWPWLSARSQGQGLGWSIWDWVWTGERRGWKGPGSGRSLRRKGARGICIKASLITPLGGLWELGNEGYRIDPASQVIPL